MTTRRRLASRTGLPLLLLAGLLAAAGQEYKDGFYNITLDSIRQEIAAAGKYPAPSESPSAYDSDFFGRQRLRAVKREDVLNALVPRLAEAVAREPHLRLRFAAGYTVVFYLDVELAVDGNRNGFRRSFAECIDFRPAFKDRYGALADFLARLEAAALSAKLLEPNPYYDLEKTAAADLKSESRPKPAGWPQRTPEARAKEKAEALAGFERAGKAVLMFGDTHGNEENFGEVWGFLMGRGAKPGFDWLGLEMLTLDEQPLLDAYFEAADGSPAFRAAENKLRGILLNGWDKRFADAATSPDGHYLRLVLWARKHKIPVYALDAPADYNMFRYGEFPLGATTRNLIWVSAVPASGKGVVYGGSAHFVPLPATPFTFQDYLKRRDPSVETFLIR